MTTPIVTCGAADENVPSVSADVTNGICRRTRRKKPTAERFWSKVVVTNDCWLWTGARAWTGHGRFRMWPSSVAAHRFSFERHMGPIPAGMCILHRCNVAHCVRPDHLYLGTELENAWDRDVAGHSATARLTADEVRAIRRRWRGPGDSKGLALEFGVGAEAIERVGRRLSWHHVPEEDAS